MLLVRFSGAFGRLFVALSDKEASIPAPLSLPDWSHDASRRAKLTRPPPPPVAAAVAPLP